MKIFNSVLGRFRHVVQYQQFLYCYCLNNYCTSKIYFKTLQSNYLSFWFSGVCIYTILNSKALLHTESCQDEHSDMLTKRLLLRAEG
jgi:hypothetical protein